MAHQAGSGDHPPAEQLRRRLYDGSATDEDRARYRALLEAAKPPEPPPTSVTPPPAAAASDRPRRPLLPIGAAIAAVAVVAGLAVETRAPAPPPVAPATPIAVDGATRSEFVQNLAGHGAAGIAAYLVTHRSPSPLHGATRFYTIERNGVGPATTALSGTPPETSEGRATVFLVVEWPGPAGWAAYGSPDDGGALLPEARRAGHQEGGIPTAATFAYRPGRRPVQLHVDVPQGVRWGAAVVFSD